jgi:predicted XRE-type DNA-binding protein
MSNTQHWTSSTLKDFAFWIASDFTAQIESIMESKPMDNAELAETLGLSPSRVSQVLNNPGNLTLGNAVKFARGTGHKVALVVYDDSDPDNNRGPISASVFEECWRRLGKPTEMRQEFQAEAGMQPPKKQPASVAMFQRQQAAAGEIGSFQANTSHSTMEP